MTWLDFGLLIHSIYAGKKLPDLAWIQRLGLLAVKLAQVHALRIDFLPREKCEHLANLYRRNDTVLPGDLDALIASAGSDILSRAKQFDRTPIASASIGQVHRAVLPAGEDAVVKIVKRNVRESFIRDVSNVRGLFSFITFFYPKLKGVGDPVGILNDIEEYTLSELDLRREVAGQKELRAMKERYATKFDLADLAFPQIYETYSNENIMVSEYVGGKTFDELLEEHALPYDTLLRLFHIHGFSMFIDGTFHGDMHPGNIMYHNDKLYFIDTGFIGHVGKKIRNGLFHFFEALSAYEYPACAKALYAMSDAQLSEARLKKFNADFLVLYRDFTDSTVGEISLTKKMMQTIKLGVESGMSFEKGIFAIIRSLMYLDGMVLRCYPKAKLVADMRPFIGEFKSVMERS